MRTYYIVLRNTQTHGKHKHKLVNDQFERV